MSKRDEELEFISVGADDGENAAMTTPSYAAESGTGSYGNVMGNWILSQSKVRNFFLFLVA